MSTAQRVSRGFHRLGLFLAAIPFLVGTVVSLYWAGGPTFTDFTRHKQLVCAHEHVVGAKKQSPEREPEKKRLLSDEEIGLHPPPSDWVDVPMEPDETRLNLKSIGCSDSDYDTISLGEARIDPPEFNWYPRLAYYLGIGVGLSLLLSFAVYAVTRAIGWVIGGFAASSVLVGLISGVLCLLLGRATGAEQYPDYEWQMGKELVRICQSQSPRDVGFCTGYIEGATAGRDIRYCFSAGVAAEQVREVVKLWLSEHPEKWHLAAHDLVVEALKEKFPCN